MDRRAFIATVTGLLAAPLAAGAQPGTAHRIGYLSSSLGRDEWSRPPEALLGTSPQIVAVRQAVAHLLSSEPSSGPPALFIEGETGTGKSVLVRWLHRAGSRAEGPFVEISFGDIPEVLLEPELFGRAGAGADTRSGLLGAAHGGTLLLDNVMLAAQRVQARLLSAVESGFIDVQIISTAPTGHLQEAVRHGLFRDDHFERLAQRHLHLPPLRSRGDDVLLLAEDFLARSCGVGGLARKTLAPAARSALLTHAWPGNVRQLRASMERVGLSTEGTIVTAEMLGAVGTFGWRADGSPASP
jgi:DNA-binding NtrC family response regulator